MLHSSHCAGLDSPGRVFSDCQWSECQRYKAGGNREGKGKEEELEGGREKVR